VSVVAVRPPGDDDAELLAAYDLDGADEVLVAEVGGRFAGVGWRRGGEVAADVLPEHADSAVRLVLVRSLSEA